MSPRTTTLLALAAVLLAGIPLPAFTGARREAAKQESNAPHPAATSPCYALVQFSGRPEQLIIRHEGNELARLPEEKAATNHWEPELELPTTAALELEIEASWPGSTQAQAITLTLEPQRQDQRQCTQWTQPEENHLHSIFLFTW